MPTSTTLSRAISSQKLWRERWAGVSGTWQSAWDDQIKRDPMLRQALMVISFRLGGGKILRYATESHRFEFGGPVSAGGAVIGVEGLLMSEPEIESTYTLGTGGSSARSFTIEIGAPGFNPWQLIMEQSRFMAGYGEVALIVPGMDWQDRFVIMRGDMGGGVSFGTKRQSITFNLSDPKITADIGITEYVLDSTRITDVAEEFVGERYPLVVNDNRPQPLMRLTATPPPDFLLGFGHNMDVLGGFVYVDGDTYASSSATYPWTVVEDYDEQGVPITILRFSAGLGVWDDSTAVHSPIEDTRGNRDVIETIRYLATNWSMLGPVGLDKVAFSRASGKINASSSPQVYINGSGGSNATRALEYIESTLCGSYPMISMAWQPGGYGPVVTDRHGPAIGKWKVGQWPLFKRETEGWQESAKTSLFNWFTVRYNYNAIEDTYESVATRFPSSHLLCAISEEQAGPQDMDPLELALITDASGGNWVADWLVDHYSLPSYYVEHAASPAILLKYKLGDNIDLVDSDIFENDWDNPVRATLEKIVYRRGQATVGLRLWPLYPNLRGSATSGGLVSLYTGTPEPQP